MPWKGSQNESHCTYDKDGNFAGLAPTLGADHPDEIIISTASALGRKRLEEEKARIAAEGDVLATEKIAHARAQEALAAERAAFAAKQAEVEQKDREFAAREANLIAREKASKEVIEKAVQKELAKRGAQAKVSASTE